MGIRGRATDGKIQPISSVQSAMVQEEWAVVIDSPVLGGMAAMMKDVVCRMKL
jgi:hypothetical protein